MTPRLSLLGVKVTRGHASRDLRGCFLGEDREVTDAVTPLLETHPVHLSFVNLLKLSKVGRYEIQSYVRVKRSDGLKHKVWKVYGAPLQRRAIKSRTRLENVWAYVSKLWIDLARNHV